MWSSTTFRLDLISQDLHSTVFIQWWRFQSHKTSSKKHNKTNFILANRPGIRMKPSLVPSHSLPSSALLTALQPTHPRPQGWSYAGDLRRWSAWLSTVHASDAKCCPRTSETAWSMLSRRWSNIFDSPLYIPVLTLGSAKNRYYATHHSHMRLYI